MNARIWMDTLSTAGRESSDRSVRTQPKTTIVEQWNAELRRFVERELVWNGQSFVDVKEGK